MNVGVGVVRDPGAGGKDVVAAPRHVRHYPSYAVAQAALDLVPDNRLADFVAYGKADAHPARCFNIDKRQIARRNGSPLFVNVGVLKVFVQTVLSCKHFKNYLAPSGLGLIILRPLRRLADNTLFPPAVLILSRKPCTFAFVRFLG